MSPEAKAESEKLFKQAMAEIRLQELGYAKGLSQEMLAEAVGRYGKIAYSNPQE